ncbi:hypothetical protein DIPPA_15314 [Diplonema papillatum]|nr:hypothetical protein DIPPA_15314 [Diplonema papillatum]
MLGASTSTPQPRAQGERMQNIAERERVLLKKEHVVKEMFMNAERMKAELEAAHATLMRKEAELRSAAERQKSKAAAPAPPDELFAGKFRREALEDRITELERALEDERALRKKIEAVRSEKDTLSNELAAAGHVIETLQAREKRRAEELEAVRKSFSEHRERADADRRLSEEQCEAEKTKAHRCGQELDALGRDFEEFSREAEARHRQLADRNRALEEAAAHAAEHADTPEKLAAARRTVKQQAEDLEVRRNERTVLLRELNEVKATLRLHTAEMSVVTAEVRAAQQASAALESAQGKQKLALDCVAEEMTALVRVIRDQQSVIHARGRRVKELEPKAKRSDEDRQAARRLKKEVEGLNAKITELQIALAAAASGLLPAGGRGDPLKPGPCDGAADAAQAPVHPHRRDSAKAQGPFYTPAAELCSTLSSPTLLHSEAGDTRRT